MKKFTRLLACALSLALLAGCAPSTPSETQTGETGESTHTFTYGLSSEPDYLDPAICMNSNTSAVLAQLYFPCSATTRTATSRTWPARATPSATTA